MKIAELEKLIQQQSKVISESGLITKCRDIAEKMGKGGKDDPNDDWAQATYNFSDGQLNINYEVYKMGDEKFDVTYENRPVFQATERVNDSPEMKHPIMVNDIDHKRFEVLKYSPGSWEKRIKDLHYKLTTDVPTEELVVVRDRFGIKISE